MTKINVSCPSRGTWIEIFVNLHSFPEPTSCPSRGTWIEIGGHPEWHIKGDVVPLAGHVD